MRDTSMLNLGNSKPQQNKPSTANQQQTNSKPTANQPTGVRSLL
jgi:hypothetical protein